MTAGSTYKLPLNMLVVDEVAEGNCLWKSALILPKLTLSIKEHDNYDAAFNGAKRRFPICVIFLGLF